MPKRKRAQASEAQQKAEVGSSAVAQACAARDGGAGAGTAAATRGNAAEAQSMRARLGISAADPRSSSSLKTFAFGFAAPASAADEDATLNGEEQACNDTEGPGLKATDTRTEAAQPSGATVFKQTSSSTEDGFVPRRAYIGGMPYDYSEEDVRECWEACGEVESVTLLTFPDTGRFRGIVFVTFVAQEGLDAALEYDGDELDGMRLVVRRCRAPRSTPTAGAANTRSGNGADQGHPKAASKDLNSQRGGRERHASTTQGSGDDQHRNRSSDRAERPPPAQVPGYNVLFVGNIPWELDKSAIEDLFAAFKPKFVRMFTQDNSHKHRGFAHVHFNDAKAVSKAIQMDGTSVMGRQLKVMYGQPSKHQKQ